MMKKEIFKLNRTKIIISAVFILLAGLVGYFTLNKALEGLLWGTPSKPQFLESVVYLFALLLFAPALIFWYLISLPMALFSKIPAVSGLTVIIWPLMTILGFILCLVYWYFLACMLYWIYEKRKHKTTL